MKTLTIMQGEKLWYLWEGTQEEPLKDCMAVKYPDEILELAKRRLEEWERP